MSGSRQSPSDALPPGSHDSMGPKLLGIIWAQVTLDVIVVALRLFVRQKKRALDWDDWLMLVALMFFIATVAVETMIVHYGLGKHIYMIPPQNTVPFLKMIFVLQTFTFWTIAFAKASIAYMIMRIMGPDRQWRKRIMWLNIGIFFVITIITSVFQLVNCRPLSANWDHSNQTGKCWPLKINANWAIVISVYSAFLDFLLALLPITLMWNLKLDTKRKFIICILLGLGVFSGIAAAVKSGYSKTLSSRADFTWEAWTLYAWSNSEFFLNIFCGTMPALKPLYDYLTKGKPMRIRPDGRPSVPWSSGSGSGWSSRFRLAGVSHLFSPQGSTQKSRNRTNDDTQSEISLRRPIRSHDEFVKMPEPVETRV